MLGLIARPYDMTFIDPASTGVNSSAVAGFPGSNLANNDYGRVAMMATSTGGYGSFYEFDLGSSKPVDVLGVLWHNFLPNETIRYIGSNNKNFSSPVYDSAGQPSTTGSTSRETLSLKKNLVTLPAPISARYWRVELLISQGSTFRQASRFFVGRGAQFAIGPQKATLGAKDLNANVTTEVGEQRSQEDQNMIRPVASLSFEYARQSEMEQLLGQYSLSLGVSKPFLVCTDLTSPYIQDNTVFGRAEKVVTLESSIYDVWSFEAVVTSLGI